MEERETDRERKDASEIQRESVDSKRAGDRPQSTSDMKRKPQKQSEKHTRGRTSEKGKTKEAEAAREANQGIESSRSTHRHGARLRAVFPRKSCGAKAFPQTSFNTSLLLAQRQQLAARRKLHAAAVRALHREQEDRREKRQAAGRAEKEKRGEDGRMGKYCVVQGMHLQRRLAISPRTATSKTRWTATKREHTSSVRAGYSPRVGVCVRERDCVLSVARMPKKGK